MATSDRRLDCPAWAKRPSNCHRHADKRLKAPENWKPGPVSDFARHPYMLKNLGQRDEPWAKVLEIGVENAHKLITEEPIKNVLKTALPHYSQFIDEQPVGAYHLLLDDLEKHLIAELQKMIRGDEQDQASVEQAARIMEMVEKASAKQAEQEVGAAL